MTTMTTVTLLPTTTTLPEHPGPGSSLVGARVGLGGSVVHHQGSLALQPRGVLIDIHEDVGNLLPLHHSALLVLVEPLPNDLTGRHLAHLPLLADHIAQLDQHGPRVAMADLELRLEDLPELVVDLDHHLLEEDPRSLVRAQIGLHQLLERVDCPKWEVGQVEQH